MLENYIFNNPILNKAYTYILFCNPSNAVPYHNFKHLLTVANACFEMAKYYELNDIDTELLVLSALFHDFNHSAGKYKDDVNVPKALTALKNFCLKYEYPNFEKCQDIILATQYPYIIENIDLNFLQKIIRDADMTQCFQEDWLQTCIIGLGAEFKKSIYDSLTGQIQFLENMQANTDWLQIKFEKELPILIQKIKNILKAAESLVTHK